MAFRFSILFSFSTTDIAVGLTSLYIKKKISKGGQSKRRRERIKSFDILLTSKKEQTYFNTLLRTNVPSYSSGFSVIIGLFLYMCITCKFLLYWSAIRNLVCNSWQKRSSFLQGKELSIKHLGIVQNLHFMWYCILLFYMLQHGETLKVAC